MFLQAAVDVTDRGEIIHILDALAEADASRIEIGTPALLSLGISALEIANSYPFPYLYADTKCVDFSVRTFQSILERTSIQGFSCHITASIHELAAIASVTEEAGVDLFLSTIGCNLGPLVSQIQRLVDSIPFTAVISHGSGDERIAYATARASMQTLRSVSSTMPIVLAGGITVTNLDESLAIPGLTGLIVGRAITQGESIVETYRYFESRIQVR